VGWVAYKLQLSEGAHRRISNTSAGVVDQGVEQTGGTGVDLVERGWGGSCYLGGCNNHTRTIFRIPSWGEGGFLGGE